MRIKLQRSEEVLACICDVVSTSGLGDGAAPLLAQVRSGASTLRLPLQLSALGLFGEIKGAQPGPAMESVVAPVRVLVYVPVRQARLVINAAHANTDTRIQHTTLA